jgi:hypothetical protein
MPLHPVTDYFPSHGFTHCRMRDAVKYFSLPLVIEHDIADCFSVQLNAIVLQYSLAEVFHDSVISSGAGLNDGSSQVIRVDDGKAMSLMKIRRDSGLP